MSLIGGDDVAANARAERASNTDALGVAETPHPPLNAPPQPASSLHTLCCPTIHPTLRQGHHAARSDHARRGWSYHARLVRGPALGGALLRHGRTMSCGACGSPSVELPRAFADSAGVHCKRCGLQLGTWGAFKEQTKKLILTELAARGQTEGVRSSDPLPGLNSGPARVP